MYKYPDDFINKIICGDCIEVMRTLEDNSVDAIVTDPPYGLEFMGKEWDKLWGKANPKVDDKHTIGAYKKRSLVQKYIAGYEAQLWHNQWATEALRILKPGGHLLSFGGTRTYHRMVCGIEDAGFEIRDTIGWLYGSGFPKSENVSQAIDKMFCRQELAEKLDRKPTREEFKKEWEGYRKVVGKKQYASPAGNNANFGVSNLTYSDTKRDLTAPATPEAKQWEGWGTALKPAFEPIVVARKPLSEKSVAENVLKWGTGGINVDECRIPHNENLSVKRDGHKLDTNNQGWGFKAVDRDNKGRFPANIIHDDSDEVLAVFPDNTSRFFYCAKASKKERNMGCEGLEERNYHMTHPQQVGTLEDRYKATNKNNHPTVKPLALMEYLIKLVSTKDAVILDPFAGSGTTLMACKKLGRKYIGIEKEEEYVKIARHRVNATPEPLF